MKTTYKRFIAIFLTVMLIISALPISANAQTGTLGTEEPYLFCAFYDSNGNAVDGNSLEAGTYTVDVVLTDMATNSVFQYTADYNEEVIEISEVSSPFSEDNDVSLGGIKNSDGTLVVVLVSNDEACTSLSSETVFTTMTVTVTSDNAIDFADYFTFNTDPDLTFVESDYGDGIEDAYTLDTTVSTTYNKYQMYVDESPALFDITGKIAIATHRDGSYDNDGMGVVGITVSTEVDGETRTAVTAPDGSFTLSGVPAGTYNVSISGPTTIDRNVMLNIEKIKSTSAAVRADSSITANTVGIVVCDYNKDGSITGLDVITFNGSYRTYNVYCDLNGDESISGLDKIVFNTFYGKNVVYDESVTF